MQIAAVKLENTKSYDNAQVEFTPGVNAIVGHNGAGKSTILEAIGFAVFDHLSYKHSEFVRSGARTATVTVTLESNQDGRMYDVVRRVGGTNVHYVHDPESGIRLCEGKQDVLAFLREHLGVDGTTDLPSLFRDAVGVAQGTFTAAFLGTPAQRKAVFDPLLKVEDYRKAVDFLRAPGRLLDDRRQSFEVEIAGLRARLEALPGLEQAVAAREGELRAADDELQKASSALRRAVSIRTELETVRTELSDLRSEYGRANERRQATARELAAARQALADAEAAQEMVQKNEPGYERYVAAQERQKGLDAQVRERARLESERARGDKAVAVGEIQLKQLRQELVSIDEAVAAMERLEEAVQRQNELESRINQARQDAARLKNVEEQSERQRTQVAQLTTRSLQLKTAMSRTTELEARIAKLQSEVEGLHTAMTALREESAGMKTQAEALKKQTAELEELEVPLCPVCEQPLTAEHRTELLRRNGEQIEDLRRRYADVQKRIKSLESESTVTANQVKESERELRQLPSAAEAERLESDIVSAQKSLEGLLAKQAALAGTPDQIQTLQNELAALGDPRREYGVAESQARRKDSVHASLAETTAELEGVRARLGKVEEELAQSGDLDAKIDACAAELRANEDAYRAVLSNRRLAVTIEERTQEVGRLIATEQETGGQIERLSERIETTAARFDEEQYAAVSAEEQTLRSTLGALEARTEMLQRQQAADRKSIVELQKKQSSLAASEAKVTVIVEQSEMLETIRALLRQAGPYVTRVLIRQVSDNARQIFSDIMQDYTRHLAWNEEYGITLEVDGHEREFSQLSGGEQMTAALSVRLALLRELSSIDVAFFDEPTANLDEARRESLARQILDVRGFRQLFVISHDDTFEQATQNLIRVERLDGVSIVSSS